MNPGLFAGSDHRRILNGEVDENVLRSGIFMRKQKKKRVLHALDSAAMQEPNLFVMRSMAHPWS